MNDKQFLAVFIIVTIVCGGLIAYTYFKPQLTPTTSQNQTLNQTTTQTEQQQPIQTYEYNQSEVLYFTDFAYGYDAGSGDEDQLYSGNLNSLKHEDGNYLVIYSTEDNAPQHTWLLLKLYSDPCPWSNIIIVVTYYYSEPVDGAINLYYWDNQGERHQIVLKPSSQEPTTRTRCEFHVTVTTGTTLIVEFNSDYDGGTPYYLYVDLAIVKQDTSTSSWFSYFLTPTTLTIICLAIVAVALFVKQRRVLKHASRR
ncbi:MAG: hypothetical protein DRJ03_12425 [Chloroflexi bacterium]|nr:MAG: hypothetical protein DRJ03_12425 [Chloroflexota bacterium]